VDHGRLVLQRFADGSREQVTPGDQLTAHAHSYYWSPRGTWFSWTICPTPSSCTTSILPADGIGEPRTLSIRNGTGPSWSPDEARLAFATPDGVLIARGDGTDPRPLGPDVTSVSGWAPDGSQVAYVHDGNVWVVGIDGSAARPITAFEFGGIGEISWSADGQHLAIVHDGTAWLAGIDGSLTRLDLGPISGVTSGVGWSPNGRILAIKVDRQGAGTTVLLPLDGRQPSVLPGVGSVTWSADSQFIAYLAPDGSTTVANADGSGARPVLPSVAEPDSLAWVRTGSPSGNQ
jgi:Tol biopolymer transport system component